MKKFLAIALLMATSLANAESPLVSRDFVARDDGLLTLDTSTGLQWLDLTLTRDLGVDQILAGEGGWVAAGFRYATFADIAALFLHAGLMSFGNEVFGSQTYVDSMWGEGDSGLDMVTKMGLTSETFGERVGTSGYVAPLPCMARECESGPYYTYYLRLVSTPESTDVLLAEGPAPTRNHSPEIGNYLIRNASYSVPEPSSFALMALGLAAVLVTRTKWRRRRLTCVTA
jgi:hypothetical protein